MRRLGVLRVQLVDGPAGNGSGPLIFLGLAGRPIRAESDTSKGGIGGGHQDLQSRRAGKVSGFLKAGFTFLGPAVALEEHFESGGCVAFLFQELSAILQLPQLALV